MTFTPVGVDIAKANVPGLPLAYGFTESYITQNPNVIYAFFDTFGIIDTMTRGGPAKATETLVYKVYQDGLLGSNLGSSAAQSVILMALVIALTAIQFRFVERRVNY